MIIFNHLLLMTGLDDVASSILRQMDSSADDDVDDQRFWMTLTRRIMTAC